MFAIPKFTLLVGASLFCSFSAAVTSPDSCQLVNPFCAPSGFNIEYYRNYLGNYSEGNFPSSYYITEGLKPLVSSYTNRTFFPQNQAPTPAVCYPPVTVLPQDGPYFVGWTRTTNGNIIVDANNFTLVYSGYYRAPATGTYNLCSSADNRNEIYMGDGNAFDCLDGDVSPSAVPLAFSNGANLNNPVNCTQVDLVEGRNYPVRNVMGNSQGPSAFNFTITGPGSSATYDFDGYAYPRECGIFI
ncbi:Floculation protein FLO1 [Hypomontagnella monticulosa]|nr:Floculation protein FLO1 [Hypomontagnella monticulosa]